MKLTLGEKTYQADMLDLYRPSIAEARTIKRHTGMTLADWRFSLVTYFREDPDMLAGLVYLLKHRTGEVVDWDELGRINAQDVIDGFEIEASDKALAERIEAEREALQARLADEPTPDEHADSAAGGTDSA